MNCVRDLINSFVVTTKTRQEVTAMTPATNKSGEVVFIPGMNVEITAGEHKGSRGRVVLVKPRSVRVRLAGYTTKTVLVRNTSMEPCCYLLKISSMQAGSHPKKRAR
jgi:hypothetical protein